MVEAKEQAHEVYEDSLAKGNAAVLAEREKKNETMTVKVGNLLPGQTAVLRLHIVTKLDIVGGFYNMSLPLAFFPDYRKHGISNKDEFAYYFNYEVHIESNGSISDLSLPENAEIVEKNRLNTSIKIRCR